MSKKKKNSTTSSDKTNNKNSNLRSRATEKRLKIYNLHPRRDSKGRILWEDFKSKSTQHHARIQPDRRWFGPTRTTTQSALQNFREHISAAVNGTNVLLSNKNAADPLPATPGLTVPRKEFMMVKGKIPYSLLYTRDHFTDAISNNILEAESFESTFGPKQTRKRPKLPHTDLTTLVDDANRRNEEYKEEKDRNVKVELEWKRGPPTEWALTAGQSNRIHQELHKVLDSSDVIVQVLDARDPLGTRSLWLERFLRVQYPHKHLILLLNKADLVPHSVTRTWLALLSQEYPTLAFHASLTKPFGKGALIQVLRQFQQLHNDKPQISVGFVGYPNVGKSSVINTLRHKKVCSVAPIPGETKVWQYITLFKRIFLIDCPGVVTNSDLNHDFFSSNPTHVSSMCHSPSSSVTTTTAAEWERNASLVLKGVIRIEHLNDPVAYIPALLSRVKSSYLIATYEFTFEESEQWRRSIALHPEESHLTFLEIHARKTGRLKKGGEPNLAASARMILNDWLRGKIPYFVPPPTTLLTNSPSDNSITLQTPTQPIEQIPVHVGFVGEESSSNEKTQFDSDQVTTHSPITNPQQHLQENTTDTDHEDDKEEDEEEEEGTEETIDDNDDVDDNNNEDESVESSSGVEKCTLTSDEGSDHTISSPSTLSEQPPSNTFDWDTLYSHVVNEQQTTSLSALTSPSVSVLSPSSPPQFSARAPLHLRSRSHKRHLQSSRSVNLLENQSTRRKTKKRRGKRKSHHEDEDDFEIVPLDQPNVNKHKRKRQRVC